MSGVVELRTATAALGLENRPEQAVNGARGDARDAAPTEVQVLLLSAGDDKAVLVGADLIWFASEQAQSLRAEIARRTGAREETVALCATHTHGTPNPDRRFAYGQWSAALVEHISARVLQAVDQTVAAKAQPLRVAIGRAAAPGIAINRRRVAWLRQGLRLRRRVQNLPNPSRPVDDRVTVIAFLSERTGKAVAMAVHFACHPVADPVDRRGADFPGFLRQELRRRFGPELVSVFLQGFCGDVRPALVHRPRGLKDRLVQLLVGDRFRAAAREDAARIGAQLATCVDKALAEAKPVEPLVLNSMRERIALADVDQAATGRDLDVTVWRWSDDVRLIFASAEMLSGLAPIAPDTIAVGYANGMVGYIAPAEDYAGGGYEIDGFLARFGLTKRFDPGIGAAFARVVAAGP
jgi:hypothetical protein